MIQVWYYRLMGRPFAGFASGEGFLTILLSVSLIPFVVAFASGSAIALYGPNGMLIAFAGGLAVLSGTHVFATSYLLVDRRQLAGVKNVPLNIVAIPLLILFVNFCSQFFFTLGQLITFLIFYMFYGIYHFGRQNLGVHAFSCLISKQRPMQREEKVAINMGVWSGIVAVSGISTPLMLKHNGVDPAPYAQYFEIIRFTAAGMYALAAVYVAQLIARNRHFYDGRTIATLLLGTFFFLPLCVSSMFAGIAAVAHGLQYLVFLAYHALSARRMSMEADVKHETEEAQDRPSPFRHARYLAPFALYVGMIYAGYALWQLAAEFQAGNMVLDGFLVSNENLVKMSIVAIQGVTMAHYWVDQHLWRFANKERRAWLLRYYPFLAPQDRGA